MTDVPALSSEVEAFLRRQAYGRATFPAIAAEAQRRFGCEAPSPAVVATYICERLSGTRMHRRFKRDIAVALWLAEEGWTATLDDTLARCARRFGAARTPSRSSLGRFLKRLGRTGAVVSRAIPADVFAYAAKHAPDMHLSDLTRITQKRFGAARAPSRSRLHRHLRQHRISTAGLRGRVEQDDELATWFRAAAGTMDLDALHDAAVVQFGPARVPSRSAIHRYLKRAGISRRFLGYRPEVVAWLRRHRNELSLAELSVACVAQFGADRAPSRSAIHRLLARPLRSTR